MIRKTLGTLAAAFMISGCALGIKTLKVQMDTKSGPAITMNVKLDHFDISRPYYSFGINIDGVGQYLDANNNGYLDPGDLERDYLFVTNGKFWRYVNTKDTNNLLGRGITYKFMKN